MATTINYDYDPRKQFLKQELTKVEGRPTQASLRTTYRDLKTNLRRIYSPNGCGTRGLLRLFYDLATYNALHPTLVATPFADPVHPGIAPIIPPNSNTANINRILQEYNSKLNQKIIQDNTDKAATEQLMAAVDPTYYQILEDPEDGYTDLTLNQLVTHLTTTYGEITTDDLNANEKRLEQQWSSSQPLEDLWTQAKQAQAFAKDHDPISEIRLVRSCTNNLESSGVFDHALRKWRAKATADQTWANLQSHFNEANTERLRDLTSGQYSANKVKVEHQDTNACQPCYQGATPMFYCWSHGLGFKPDHTSKTCQARQKGHQTTATFYNMMGGCNRIWRVRDERPVWKPNHILKKEAENKENAAPGG